MARVAVITGAAALGRRAEMGDFLVCALSSIRSYKHNVINYWLYADVANRRAGIETKIGCHTFQAADGGA
jgi:hypothetical protein